MATIFEVAAIAVTGWTLLYLLGRLIVSLPDRPNPADELEAEYAMRQLRRSAEKQRVLWNIKAAKDDEVKRELWERYYELDAADRELTEQERGELLR